MAKEKTAKEPKKPTAKNSATAKKTRTPVAKSKTAKKKRNARAVPDVLSLEERTKLLRPRAGFLDLLGRVTRDDGGPPLFNPYDGVIPNRDRSLGAAR